ncbi:hypothetical protein Dform_00811 [Dehalogenimonas formicexedens]|uniref:Uncharacterized protein n=1 Tax=Dehalogenimonas formicexedens TaxID=1839801 RepID=A0A1P8F6Q4_9CHLR|nr:hypothetical protein [Dehalogenimonas formicexedens]APV44159.1 hypothetical protein Dform_00811 [Dehalogenimonas formicexedens]
MVTRKETIQAASLEIIKTNPDGIRYSSLVNELHKKLPEYPINTIHGTVWDLEVQLPDKIYKPERGVYKLVAFREEILPRTPETQQRCVRPTQDESKFYGPFADWLIGMDECSRAISLGGKKFKDKWGTPDVIGIREPSRSDIIKLPTEIVTAEIKVDTNDLITAFGQACAYRVFSHKSYIVIPKNSSGGDISRLDALCMIFGLGLVLFDKANIEAPEFEIRTRPQKHEPDMFYANSYLKLIEKELFQ